jgi:hypothetical protein
MVDKKEVEKHGLICPSTSPKLTLAEQEVLHLISDEFLTLKQISKRRQCSLQAVYKIIKKLKQKGAYGTGLNKVENIQPTFNQSDIRLHGQEFNIRILFQDNKYQELLNKSNTLFIDSNTIRLYKNSIEIYSGNSFYGKNSNEAEKHSLEYFERLFNRLEHDLSISIKKNRARNIKIVNQHYARGNSEICDNYTQKHERVWVYAEEDGKLCFITDDSFGFREDETIHPTTSKIDRKAIDKQINDWRLNNPPTNSELAINIDNLTKIMNYYGENLVSHVKAIQDLSKGVKKLTKLGVNLLNENNKLKLGNQKTIWDF